MFAGLVRDDRGRVLGRPVGPAPAGGQASGRSVVVAPIQNLQRATQSLARGEVGPELIPAGTKRFEEEVVRLIAQGYSNKEIAAQLDVSVKSVETYKTRSMAKLGLNSRVDLVRFVFHLGWLKDM